MVTTTGSTPPIRRTWHGAIGIGVRFHPTGPWMTSDVVEYKWCEFVNQFGASLCGETRSDANMTETPV
jgi:hypothetical protein